MNSKKLSLLAMAILLCSVGLSEGFGRKIAEQYDQDTIVAIEKESMHQKCIWLNRGFLEARCMNIEKKEGRTFHLQRENQAAAGICSGEIVCDDWKQRVLNADFKWELKNRQAGVFKVQCNAQNGTCLGVTPYQCYLDNAGQIKKDAGDNLLTVNNGNIQDKSLGEIRTPKRSLNVFSSH